MSAPLETLTVVLTAATDSFKREMEGATEPLSRFGGVAATVKTSVVTAFAAVTTAVTAFGVKGIAEAAKFEDSMAAVYRNIGNTSQELEDQLQETVRTLSSEYGIGANEAAAALADFAYSGLSAEEAQEALETAMQLSIATSSDLATAMQFVDASYAAFKNNGYEYEEIMDILTAGSAMNREGLEGLGKAVVSASAAASSANVPFEVLTAAITGLAWAGLTAAESSTKAKRMFTEFADGSSDVGKIIEGITGKTFPEFMAGGGDLMELLQALDLVLANNNTSWLEIMGSSEGAEAAILLLNAGYDGYIETLDRAVNSTGATADAIETMSGTVKHQTDLLKSGMEGLYLTAGEFLLPIWSEALQAVNAAMPQIQQVVETVFSAIADGIYFVQSLFSGEFLSGLATAEDGTITSIGRMIESFSGFWQQTTALLGAIGEFITSVFMPFFDGLAPWIGPIWDGIVSLISAAVDLIALSFSGLVLLWEEVLKPAWDFIAPYVETVFGAMGHIIVTALDVVTGLINGLVSLLKGDFSGAWDHVQGVIESVAGFIGASVTGIASLFGQAGIDFLDGLVEGLQSGLSNVLTTVQDIGSRIWEGFKGFFGINSPSTLLAQAGQWLMDGLVEGLQDKIGYAINAIKDVGERVWNGFKNFFGIASPSRLMETAGEYIIAGLDNGIRDNSSKPVDAVQELADQMKEVIDDLKNWIDVLDIQLTYGFGDSQEMKAELEALKADLLEQLTLLEEAGEAGSVAYMHIAEQLAVVEGGLGKVNRAIAAADSAAEEAAEEELARQAAQTEELRRQTEARNRIIANQYEVARAEGEISDKEHMALLQVQLAHLEMFGFKYSDEWMALYNELSRLRAEDEAERNMLQKEELKEAERAAREAAALAEQEAKDRMAYEQAVYDFQRHIGQISDAEHLKNLKTRLQATEESSQEYIAIQREIYDYEQKLLGQMRDAAEQAADAQEAAARERQSIADAEYAYQRHIGQVTLKDHLANLTTRLATEELTALERIALEKEIYDVTRQLSDQHLANVQEAKLKQEAYERALYEFRRYTGEISRQEHIANLQAQLAATEEYTEEHIALQQQIASEQAAQAAEEQALADRVIQHRLAMNQMSTEDYLAHLRTQLDATEAGSVEWMDLAEEVYNLEEQLNSDRIQSHEDAQAAIAKAQQETTNKVFQAIDGVRAILGDFGLDADSAWGKAIDGGIAFAKALSSGDWIGAIVSAVRTVISLIGDMSNGVKETEKAIADMQKTLLWTDAEKFGERTRVSRGGILGFFGATKEQFSFDEIALDIARSLEQGISSGIRSGMKAFITGESISVVKAVSDSIRSSIEDAIIEGIISSAMMKAQLGDLVQNLTNAVMSGDAAAIADLEKQLQAAVSATSTAIESALKPVKGVLDSVFGTHENELGRLKEEAEDAEKAAQLAEKQAKEAEQEAEKARQEAETRLRNEYMLELESGAITLAEHIETLQEKLAAAEEEHGKYSDDWMKIFREIEKTEGQIAANREKLQKEQEKAAQDAEKAALQAAKEAEAKLRNEYMLELESGVISLAQHIENLQSELEDVEAERGKFSDEWMKVHREIQKAEAQITADREKLLKEQEKAAEDALKEEERLQKEREKQEQAAYNHALQQGWISLDTHLENLQKQLAAFDSTEVFGSDWTKVYNEIAKVHGQIAKTLENPPEIAVDEQGLKSSYELNPSGSYTINNYLDGRLISSVVVEHMPEVLNLQGVNT